MSPSRGLSSNDVSTSTEPTTDQKANLASSSALTSARKNLAYLFSPSSSSRPASLRTRALLSSLRYIGVFIFWRVVRYAKYALVGAAVAALGATAFGGAVTGVGWILAPPTFVGSVGIGLIWAVGKWGFRKMGVRERLGADVEIQQQREKQRVAQDGQWRQEVGPRAMPW